MRKTTKDLVLLWHRFTLYLRAPLSILFFLWLLFQKEDNNLLLRSLSVLEVLLLALFVTDSLRKHVPQYIPLVAADGLLFLFSIPFLILSPQKTVGVLLFLGTLGEIFCCLCLKETDCSFLLQKESETSSRI